MEEKNSTLSPNVAPGLLDTYKTVVYLLRRGITPLSLSESNDPIDQNNAPIYSTYMCQLAEAGILDKAKAEAYTSENNINNNSNHPELEKDNDKIITVIAKDAIEQPPTPLINQPNIPKRSNSQPLEKTLDGQYFFSYYLNNQTIPEFTESTPDLLKNDDADVQRIFDMFKYKKFGPNPKLAKLLADEADYEIKNLLKSWGILSKSQNREVITEKMVAIAKLFQDIGVWNIICSQYGLSPDVLKEIQTKIYALSKADSIQMDYESRIEFANMLKNAFQETNRYKYQEDLRAKKAKRVPA
jgi:hypothetical protein